MASADCALKQAAGLATQACELVPVSTEGKEEKRPGPHTIEASGPYLDQAHKPDQGTLDMNGGRQGLQAARHDVIAQHLHETVKSDSSNGLLTRAAGLAQNWRLQWRHLTTPCIFSSSL